jgi:hypothetical protein
MDWEVGHSFGAPELHRCFIISLGSLLLSVECAEVLVLVAADASDACLPFALLVVAGDASVPGGVCRWCCELTSMFLFDSCASLHYCITHRLDLSFFLGTMNELLHWITATQISHTCTVTPTPHITAPSYTHRLQPRLNPVLLRLRRATTSSRVRPSNSFIASS